MDVDEGVRGQRGHDGGDGRQQEDPGRLVGAGTSPLLVNSLSSPNFSDMMLKQTFALQNCWQLYLASLRLNFLSLL